jgi:hypothetical protein
METTMHTNNELAVASSIDETRDKLRRLVEIAGTCLNHQDLTFLVHHMEASIAVFVREHPDATDVWSELIANHRPKGARPRRVSPRRPRLLIRKSRRLAAPESGAIAAQE